MDQRKLIRLGNSSFAIALPKDWIEKSGLKKGDNIFITKNSSGELIIAPEFKGINGKKEIEIDLKGKKFPELWTEITADYVKGYTSIRFINKKKKESADIIKKAIQSLLGFEIVENTKEQIIVKDFFNIEEINLQNFVRRIDNNIREMIDYIIEYKTNKITSSNLTEIINADKDINKFYLLMSRIFYHGLDNPAMLNMLKTNAEILFMDWWLSFNLEHIGDEIKSIANILKNSKISAKDSEKISFLSSEVKDIYTKSMESFYKKDKNLALESSKKGKKIWEELNKESKSDDPIISKIAMRLKEIETSSYQNTKLIAYMRY
jgi:phosphate uptake regulator